MGLRQNIKNAVLRICSPFDLFPVRRTDSEKVQALIKKLRPKGIDIPLIRLGPKGDGGYLIPDDLEGIEACYSPGVSTICGFEKDCADRGMRVFLADYSVERPPLDHERFHFTKKFIGAVSRHPFITLDEWVKETQLENDADLLLQMDIEGYEYEALLAASQELLRRFRILVIEFHNLDQLWNRYFFDFANAAFEKILQTHTCVHIHPNNCCGKVTLSRIEIPSVMEFTFLRKERVKPSGTSATFPHPLDCDNTDKPTIPLPRCWYE